MSCDIFTDKFVSDVITGLQKCSDPLQINCLECPWSHHPKGCRITLEQSALIIIKHYRDENGCLETELKKRIDELRKAEMEIEYQMDRNKALDRELTRYKEQEQMLAKQPVVHFDEPMRIEPISTFGVDLKTARKVAKALNKAAIACERFNKALDELAIVATKF